MRYFVIGHSHTHDIWSMFQFNRIIFLMLQYVLQLSNRFKVFGGADADRLGDRNTFGRGQINRVYSRRRGVVPGQKGSLSQDWRLTLTANLHNGRAP